MTYRQKVVVSRKWNSPNITVFITDEEIGIAMSLDNWIEAVVSEIGNPTLMVTKAQLKDNLIKAAEAIATEMKQSTVVNI